MGLPHVTSFCFCMGLEMGAKFVGFLHLAVSVTLVVLCATFAEGARANMGTVEDAGDQLYSRWYVVAVTVAAISVVHVLMAGMLIVSAFKRVTWGLKAWVWVMCVLCAAAVLFVVVETCLHGVADEGSDIFVSFLEGVLFFGTVMYCILCVYSYYLMLKSAEDMSGPKSSC